MKAKTLAICVGVEGVEGCSVALSFQERRRGSACEYCELAWTQRLRSWRLGERDDVLEEMFGLDRASVDRLSMSKAT
jgi:hypothetical protein